MTRDVTSHRRGFGVQPLIDAAARQAQTNPEHTDVLWLVPSQLTTAFRAARGMGGNAEVRNCDVIGPLLWTAIQQEIEKHRSTAPDTIITVVTWDQFIYGSAQNFTREIVAAKWFDWLGGDRQVYPSRLAPGATPDRVTIPQSAALPSADQLRAFVLNYLKSVRATSESQALYRSQLRPALVRHTPELQGASMHPAFAVSFKSVLDNAVLDRLIGQECSTPGKERIWAMELPAVVASPPGPPPVREESVPEKTVTAPTFERTAQFRKRLTDLGIFCEKRERDLLMEAMEQTLKTGPQTVSRLRRELPKIAQAIATGRGVCTATDFKRVSNFFLKLLLVSGVLKDQAGNVIERNIRAEATAVAGLIEDALDVAESYLLEQILKKSDVQDREHWQLASTLFREFDSAISMDDKLDRIAVLIGGLSRVTLTDDGMYAYTSNTGSAVRAIRA